MARPLRIEFEGAIYHVMARGNAGQVICTEPDDYHRLREGLAQTVGRYGWETAAFALMPNHLHLLIRTPQPNLSRGMQYLLSGYANWHARRHERPGHLFQGRFRGELIEDETYFWAVSRYIHLNPVRGRRPLAPHPRDWPWSSYPGYARRRERLSWMAYDLVYRAWQGEMGGSHPDAAYRRFVEAGIAEAPDNPLRAAAHGWLLGGEQFIERMRDRMKVPKHPDETPRARKLVRLSLSEVIAVVAAAYDVTPESFRQRRSGQEGRDVAAWLARRMTTATLRELAESFGLTHPDSVNNLVRRIDRQLSRSPQLRRKLAELQDRLQKTGNRV